jgi:hypothetical protein
MGLHAEKAMLVSVFLLGAVICVLAWACVVQGQEVYESRKALDQQGELLGQMVSSLTRTQGRGARSIANRSQSFRHILRDVPGVDAG